MGRTLDQVGLLPHVSESEALLLAPVRTVPAPKWLHSAATLQPGRELWTGPACPSAQDCMLTGRCYSEVFHHW